MCHKRSYLFSKDDYPNLIVKIIEDVPEGVNAAVNSGKGGSAFFQGTNNQKANFTEVDEASGNEIQNTPIK